MSDEKLPREVHVTITWRVLAQIM